MAQQNLVLGSTSPYRRELLLRLGLDFVSDSPDIDESRHAGETPQQLVERLAVAKARAVAERHAESLIIGSDQVACLGGQILGKPGTRENAIEQLRRAAGKPVIFYTGLCLLNAKHNRVRSVVEPYQVYFRHLSDVQIGRYVDHEQPFNCAGSFKSEGLGISLFTRLEGDDPNALIGLPLIRLIDMLAAEGIEVP